MMQYHDVRENQILVLCVFVLDSTGFPVLSGTCMKRLSSHFTGFPVLFEEPSSSCKRLPTISCEWDVFPFSTKTRSVSTVSPFDHRLDWVWIGLVWKIQHEVLLQRLLNELSNWLLFNCRTRLIIPFSQIVIVFQ